MANAKLSLRLLGFHVNTGQRAGMPSTQAVRGQIGGSIRTKQHGECTVASLRSKHRVFSNTSCVFKNKTDLIIDRGSFYYRKKGH